MLSKKVLHVLLQVTCLLQKCTLNLSSRERKETYNSNFQITVQDHTPHVNAMRRQSHSALKKEALNGPFPVHALHIFE